MGLIKAVMGAAGGVLADQWKEFFYCESLTENVMVTKGQKRVSGRSSNTKGEENIITTGSGIAVANGQCMIIVEQGKVLDLCAGLRGRSRNGVWRPRSHHGCFPAGKRNWEAAEG